MSKRRATWRALVLWALDVGGQEHNVYPTLYGPPGPRTAQDVKRAILDRDHPDHDFYLGFVTNYLQQAASARALGLGGGGLARFTGIVEITAWVKGVLNAEVQKHNAAVTAFSGSKAKRRDGSSLDKPCTPDEKWYEGTVALAAACLHGKTKGDWPKKPADVVAAVVASGLDTTQE